MQIQAIHAHRSHASMLVPDTLRTARLMLRPWRAEDADALLPILEANQAHLGPWIPPRVWSTLWNPVCSELHCTGTAVKRRRLTS